MLTCVRNKGIGFISLQQQHNVVLSTKNEENLIKTLPDIEEISPRLRRV